VVASSAASPKSSGIHQFFTWPPHVVAIVLMVAAIGCKRDASDAAIKTSSTGTDSAASASKPERKKVDLQHPVVRIETSAGSITLRLDGVRARGAVRNFLDYANDKFYDNTLVHYVDPGKMIVAGGYSADGKPKPARTPIRNEAHNGLKNIRGTIAMARDQSLIDSATSQFFINLADAPQRDHTGDSAEKYGYCVFGEITEGLDVADKISQSPTANQGGDLVQTPDPPVSIKSIRVVQ
jgi:cyclophilin family peptidyl-prolyl cis-trans isomerase